MKSFIIAVLLLAALIFGVITNAIYINEASELFCHEVTALPEVDSPNCKVALESLCDEWQSRRHIIELSTDLRRLTEIDTLLSTLRAAAHDGAVSEYNKTRAVLGDLFAELRAFESLEFFDIF